MFSKRSVHAPATLSDAIREAVCEKKLTAYTLGKQAGVSAGVIQRFLAGERSLTLTTADKLVRALNLELCEREAGVEEGVGDAPAASVAVEAPATTEVPLAENEAVVIGGEIRIVLKGIRGKSVRFAVFAPADALVRRGEIGPG